MSKPKFVYTCTRCAWLPHWEHCNTKERKERCRVVQGGWGLVSYGFLASLYHRITEQHWPVSKASEEDDSPEPYHHHG